MQRGILSDEWSNNIYPVKFAISSVSLIVAFSSNVTCVENGVEHFPQDIFPNIFPDIFLGHLTLTFSPYVQVRKAV